MIECVWGSGAPIRSPMGIEAGLKHGLLIGFGDGDGRPAPIVMYVKRMFIVVLLCGTRKGS